MEEVDKGWRIRMGVSWRMFLLAPAYPGSQAPRGWVVVEWGLGMGHNPLPRNFFK